MNDGADVTVLRFGWVHPLIGVTFVVISVAIPLLMWWNGEEIDSTIIVTFVAFAIVGSWLFFHLRAYEVRVSDVGFVLLRLGFPPVEVQWSSVILTRPGRSIAFDTLDGRAVKVNAQLPGLDRLLAIAEKHVPPTVWPN